MLKKCEKIRRGILGAKKLPFFGDFFLFLKAVEKL